MSLNNLTADDLYKIATAIAVIFGLYKTYVNNSRAAKRDTVDDMHRMIERLDRKVNEMEKSAKAQAAKIEELENDNLSLRKRILEQDDWIRRLVAQLVEANITPVPSMRTNE